MSVSLRRSPDSMNIYLYLIAHLEARGLVSTGQKLGALSVLLGLLYASTFLTCSGS